MECIKKCGADARPGYNYCAQCWESLLARGDTGRKLTPLPTAALIGIILILFGLVMIVAVLRA